MASVDFVCCTQEETDVNKRVLIADDESPWRHIVGEEVKKLGYEYHAVDDDGPAEKLLDAGHYDLIISDNHMSFLRNDGVRFLARLRAKGNKIPFIIHSRDLDGWGLRNCEKMSATYVEKSYGSQHRLVAAISALLGE